MYANQNWNGSAGLMGLGTGMGMGMGLSGLSGLSNNVAPLGGNFRGFAQRAPARQATLGGVRPATFTEGKLFLGGLDSTTTKESLVSYCSQWGHITDAVVMEGRGFGFVTFEDPSSAQAFLEQRSHTIDGKSVEAKAAVPKGVGSGSNLTKKLFVGGTGELTDDDFREYFSQYGVIQDAVIVRKQDGTSRGFGFVTFADEMSVEKCLVVQHELKGRKVDLRRAVPREQMANQYGFGFGSSLSGIRGGYGLSGFGVDLGSSYGIGTGFGQSSMGTMGSMGSMGSMPTMPSMGSMGSMGSIVYSNFGARSQQARSGPTDRFRPY